MWKPRTFVWLWREPLQECTTLNINLASFPRVFPPGMAVLGWESSGDVVAESSLCSVLSRSQAWVATYFVWNEPCCRPWRFTFTSLGCFTHFYSWATFVARNVRRLPRSPGSICQVTTFQIYLLVIKKRFSEYFSCRNSNIVVYKLRK